MRTGSPFAVDPVPYRQDEERADQGAGVASEMARGGSLAGWLLIPFAVPCVWGFPFGGVLIAGLGSLLSLFGCAAPRLRWAITALLIHISLLTFASLRWLEIAP